MIFISHNHKDKILVEQIALRLKDTFGQENVFYDSWSIQPGDGIIDKMNSALEFCQLFLFFVSKNSLQSNMVKLEWQNAVLKAANGRTRIIPVKLDDSFMPPILAQNLYIDLYGNGLEIALRQIVDVSEGRNTFQPGPQHFSNLKAYVHESDGSTIIECHAEHYLEPISNFLFMVDNKKEELTFTYKSGNMCNSGFNEGLSLQNGMTLNGQLIGVERGTVPGFPLVVQVTPTGNAQVRLLYVMHEKKSGEWSSIPLIRHRKSV